LILNNLPSLLGSLSGSKEFEREFFIYAPRMNACWYFLGDNPVIFLKRLEK
jgi:hypothetical protein